MSYDQSLVFLEFEYIFTICIILVIVLMYLFYVKYPYEKDVETPHKSILELATRLDAMKEELVNVIAIIQNAIKEGKL